MFFRDLYFIEPCPCYWARLDKIYFSNTKNDAKNIDFDDSFIYDEIALPLEKRKIPFIRIEGTKAIEAFNEWKINSQKIHY